MKTLNGLQPILLLLLFIFLGWVSVFFSIPRYTTTHAENSTEFSTKNAMDIVKSMSVSPHFTGSKSHKKVQNLLIKELEKLNLTPTIQKGFSISKTGSCAYVENIVAKIDGKSSKVGVLLLSHYDSAVHSSPGASDAASGVATILESLRAYKASGKIPENTIYICFTDGEELGLLGAKLFTQEHPWARHIKLIFNFEARGSGGGSFMLVETNQKNQKLIQHFDKANTPYPIANSLAYSVYKMLPNDTDLTVFREQLDIDGYNFAFIDDHYDYHTANDTWQNLDVSTLAHQGSYAMAILNYFTQFSDFDLKSEKDVIYFDFPVLKLIYYSETWIIPLLISISILLILCTLFALKKNLVSFKKIVRSLGILLFTLLVCSFILYFGWKIITIIYPEYLEIQHGFTYNGNWYIYSAIALAVLLTLMINRYTIHQNDIPSFYIANAFLWLGISLLTVIYLEGASYFIWVVVFSLINISLLIYKKEINPFLLFAISSPVIFIIAPFIYRLPVALGLQMLFISGILTVLLVNISIPLIANGKKSKSLMYIIGSFVSLFLITAHIFSSFSEKRPKPNSLLYITNHHTNQSVWATYDEQLDEWVSPFIKNRSYDTEEYNENTIENKYGKQFSYVSPAPSIKITPLRFDKNKDTLIDGKRNLTFTVSFAETMDRLDIYTDTIINFKSLFINGKSAVDFTYKNGKIYNAFTKRWSKNLATFYNTGKNQISIKLSIANTVMPEFIFYASSYNLLENKELNISKRKDWMMTKPFLLNDAIVNAQTVNLDTILIKKDKDSVNYNFQKR